MAAPRGHKPYSGCEKGSAYGYLGKPQDAYTQEDLIKLGNELIEYMNEPRSIWYKGFCNRKGMKWDHFIYLRTKYPIFAEYAEQAKRIQEEKITTSSFWKEGDGNFGKFILEKHHEDWKPDALAIDTEKQAKLDKAAELVDYLMSKSDRKIAESNINKADKSKLDTDD